MKRLSGLTFIITALVIGSHWGIALSQVPGEGEGESTTPPANDPMPSSDPGDDHRPEGYSTGIGFGWRLPTDLQTPNITSARFRLGSGLTFEPSLVLSHASSTQDMGMMNTSTGTTDIEVATSVRYPLQSRDRVDFDVIGSVGFGMITTNPDGADNNSTTTAFGLGYGLGVDFWVSHHWLLSMTATNPLFTYTKTSMQQMAGGDTGQSTNAFGLVWDPTITGMVHVFF